MYDCIVVGGGLIGMMTARQLTLEGQSVLLLDQGQLGSESSWAGGGILSPLYPWRYPQAVSDLAAYSHRHYPALAQTLLDESGIDPQWTQSGLLILDVDEKQQAQSWAQSVWLGDACYRTGQRIIVTGAQSGCAGRTGFMDAGSRTDEKSTPG